MNNKDLVDRANYIFFDFFDTIVHRKVDEQYLLEQWANSLSIQLNYAVQPEMLYRGRKKATKIVLKKNKTEEPDYYSIIKELYGLFHCSLYNVKFTDFFEISEKIELELEKSILFLDEDCKKIIEYALKIDKKIFIISDFYLGKVYLADLLESVGLNSEVFTDIYVSCEYGKKKKSGNLYKIIINERALNPQECLMIGDNEEADGLMSKSNGFTFIHRPYYCRKNMDVFQELNGIRKKYSRYSFANYAFGFYRFIDLLYKESIKNGYSELLFLAREGYILKKFFDIYQNGLEKKVQTKYLYVSRFSTFLPSLKPLCEEKFEGILEQYGDISLKSFLKNLQFTDKEIEKVVDNNINIDEIIRSFDKSLAFEKLKKNVCFQNIYNTKVKNAQDSFIEYFRSVTTTSQSSIVLVDIGWKGTMQDNLYKIFGCEKKFIGLYFGIFNETGMECASNIKKGLVFDKYPYKSKNYDVWEFETHLIEQLMVAPHGSTVGYVDEEGVITPKLEWTDEDKKLYYLARPIQEQIIRCFEEISILLNNRCISEKVLEKIFTKEQLRAELLLSDEMLSFEKIALSEKTNNFGWFDKIPTSASKKEKIVHLLKDLKNISSDKETKSTLKFLHYFAVKMKGRGNYNWTTIIYRCFYLIEKSRV